MKKYGLVLAGGGGKGAYQIGAWKAMREMGIEFESIAGVSIGGINGAFIAADDYDKATVKQVLNRYKQDTASAVG